MGFRIWGSYFQPKHEELKPKPARPLALQPRLVAAPRILVLSRAAVSLKQGRGAESVGSAWSLGVLSGLRA